jgi:hypothetical protein
MPAGKDLIDSNNLDTYAKNLVFYFASSPKQYAQGCPSIVDGEIGKTQLLRARSLVYLQILGLDPPGLLQGDSRSSFLPGAQILIMNFRATLS